MYAPTSTMPATLFSSANLTAAHAPLEWPMMTVSSSTPSSVFMKGSQMERRAVTGSGMLRSVQLSPDTSFSRCEMFLFQWHLCHNFIMVTYLVDP